MLRFEIMPFAKGEAQAAEVPLVGDRSLGLAGLHLFTFNELVATWDWSQELPPAQSSVA